MRLSVRVEPRSSKKEVIGFKEGVLKVKLTAPPAEGEANEQLVEILAEVFGVKKSAVKIIKGHTAKNKIVDIEGIDAAHPVLSKTDI